MVTFRNNNGRRGSFRRGDRNYKQNPDRSKYGANFSNSESFQRKVPGRNNHNASKLIEKYSNLAREALSVGDKILSENYFQHADHFTRILNEKEVQKKFNSKNKVQQEIHNLEGNKEKNIDVISEKDDNLKDQHSEIN